MADVPVRARRPIEIPDDLAGQVDGFHATRVSKAKAKPKAKEERIVVAMTLSKDTATRLGVYAAIKRIDQRDVVEALIGPVLRSIRIPTLPDLVPITEAVPQSEGS